MTSSFKVYRRYG